MKRLFLSVTLAALGAGCAHEPPQDHDRDEERATPAEYYGTLEPFASEAVYFIVTDRFVDGDRANNHIEQGKPDWGTYNRPITDLEGRSGNIGYLGGDFRGVLDHAAYIRDMGFTAVWMTPVIDNPDEAFSGGHKLGEAFFADHGKTGYHGYWGVNFFETDEHLVSDGLGYSELTAALKEHGLKTVLDVVCNHNSPSYTMPVDQPKYGELYDQDGTRIADHQNVKPEDLDDGNPLHAMFNRKPDLAELGDFDSTNPAVLDYFVRAYLYWIDQGAAAFRIDTIRHMPHDYWRQFSTRIRAEHPGFFMFSESFQYDAEKVAEHTYSANGAISVLDFPGQKAIADVFSNADSNFGSLVSYLHLDDEIYRNPYDLMLFYDNHDMPRMNTSVNGFIDAHNWLFTSRGIPVVYYGSEIGFRAGRPEHGGNRDYFGVDNIRRAQRHPIRKALAAIATIRRESPALQRGLQANLAFGGHSAAFFRVYQRAGSAQTALVLLNKSDALTDMAIGQWLSAGEWRDAASNERFEVARAAPVLTVPVPAHGVRVLLFDAPNNNKQLAVELDRLQEAATSGDR